MATYSVGEVERLLRNYLDIRHTLEGQIQQRPDTYIVSKHNEDSEREQPLGASSSQPWPFMEPRRSKSPQDGKAKARLMQELHVSVLDIEEGLRHLTDDDLELIYKHHILQTHTLDDLVAERQVTSKGSMKMRVQRAVQRLVRAMEQRP